MLRGLYYPESTRALLLGYLASNPSPALPTHSRFHICPIWRVPSHSSEIREFAGSGKLGRVLAVVGDECELQIQLPSGVKTISIRKTNLMRPV